MSTGSSTALTALRDAGFTTIEPTETAQAGWGRHMADCSMVTLHRLANTWYTGANVPGKAQGLMPYTGGVGPYRSICDEVVGRGMLGFKLTGPNGAAQCNDGEVVRLQPDVRLVLNLLASLNLPPIESMGAQGARAFVNEFNKGRPAGRPIGEIVDGTLPGADGPLPYRLYRPATPGPHPIVVYFHGGGWVLGDEQSDEPFCRDMCRRTGMIFVSVGYRHAPEHRFPAAAEDGYAATRWIAEHAAELGGKPGPLLVAGWSAGGNIAAVTCQLARDRGGPEIAGQLLVCPVTDCTFDRPSYNDNATGYFLTRALMYWFWDLYCSPADRTDPRVSPLRGKVAGLPPAFVVDLRIRSAARRRHRLCRGDGGRRRPGRATQGARPFPLVLCHGRRGDHRRQRPGADGRGLAALRRASGSKRGGPPRPHHLAARDRRGVTTPPPPSAACATVPAGRGAKPASPAC